MKAKFSSFGFFIIPRKYRTLFDFETKLHFNACNFCKNWCWVLGKMTLNLEHELQLSFGLEIMQILAQIWPAFFSDPFYDPLSLQFTGTINHTSNGKQVPPGHSFIILVLGQHRIYICWTLPNIRKVLPVTIRDYVAAACSHILVL